MLQSWDCFKDQNVLHKNLTFPNYWIWEINSNFYFFIFHQYFIFLAVSPHIYSYKTLLVYRVVSAYRILLLDTE